MNRNNQNQNNQNFDNQNYNNQNFGIVYNILCKQKSQEKLKKRHRKKRLLGVK